MDAKLLDEAMKAGSAKELREMAGTRGVELTEAEAENYYCRMHRLGELSDDELSGVAGGGCQIKEFEVNSNEVSEGDLFMCTDPHTKYKTCPACGCQVFRVDIVFREKQSLPMEGSCSQCGKKYPYLFYQRSRIWTDKIKKL